MTNRKLHVRFRLAPRSMTLDDLELYKFEFSENFSGFRRFRTQQQHKLMKIDQYCQRQRCKHVELVQFWHAFAWRGFVSVSWDFLYTLYSQLQVQVSAAKDVSKDDDREGVVS